MDADNQLKFGRIMIVCLRPIVDANIVGRFHLAVERSLMTNARKTNVGDNRRLGDMVVEGSKADFLKNLDYQVGQLEKKASEIWAFEELGSASRVLPGLLRATSRQLLILKASCDLPVEVVAGACRTTFELNLRTRLVLDDASQFDKTLLELAGDEQSLLQGILKLANPDDYSVHQKIIEDRLVAIQKSVDRRNIKCVKPKKIKDMADIAGVGLEYEALYRFYSKYVHASAWLSLASDDRREGIDFRNILEAKTQQYAGDTYLEICDWISKKILPLH